MSGIITLAELVCEIVDDEDDFTGTVYAGPPIHRVTANMGGSENLKTTDHPNLMRKLIEVSFERVRIGAGNPHYRDLLLAVQNRLLSHPSINAKFGNRVVFINNPNEVAMGITMPYLGIFDGDGPTGLPRFAGQREETLIAKLYVFAQSFPKNVTEQMIGD